MKRLLACVLSAVMLLLLAGCTIPMQPPEPTDDEIIMQQQETVKIGFASDSDNFDHVYILTLPELSAWDNPYSIYNSYYFYDTLNDDEKIVYRAVEYAMTYCYTQIFIDSRIDVFFGRMEKIVEYLSLDTPLLEQNLTCSAGNAVAYYNYQVNESRTVEVPLRSSYISVRNFSRELWQKKMLALAEAKKVFSTFNTDCTDVELAEQIYQYVALNIEYIPYENEYGHYKGMLKPFLYDAFIHKKTHCDGYANAMALLFALAGIEQIEKSGYTTDSGHTWNCVKLEGKWYNCDGTMGGAIMEQYSTMGSGLGFAFSDHLQHMQPENEKHYPVCDESYYMNPDAHLESCKGQKFINAVNNGFAKHDGEWALMLVDEYDEDIMEQQLQEIANQNYTTVNVKIYHLINKTALLYYK